MSAQDGVISVFRRWENDADFTLLYAKTNASIGSSSGLGMRAGYLFGYRNAKTTFDVEWRVDDFELSSAPLVPGY